MSHDEAAGSFVVPECATPTISVCMVTFGAREWVERSLRSLIDHTPPGYELIVVDNGSTDGTAEMLRSRLQGATVVLPGRNLGFAAGNDLAAAHARGRYLCLLNPDAIVPAGWLPPLLAPFDQDPTVGATVPAFIWPDGVLQEAGSVVEADGLVVAYGARGDADDPELRFPREVPYASAACLVIRRSTFLGLGGLDPAYGVGYYEDVDLAFELARRGLRVWLEPSVRVVHAQGATSPNHEVAVARRDANRTRFTERWGPDLVGRPAVFGAPQPHRRYAARDFAAPDRLLVVCDRLPEPGTGTAWAARSALRTGRVSLLLLGGPGEDSARDAWLAHGVEVAAPEAPDEWLAARRFHFAAVLTDPAVANRVDEALSATQPQAARAATPGDTELDRPGALLSLLLNLGLVPVALGSYAAGSARGL